MTEPERAKNPFGTLLLQAVLIVCWALVLAKTYFLIRGHQAPDFINYSYMVALPVALWYFKAGLELLGVWFYLGVLSFIEAGAVFWIVRAWRRYILNDEAKAYSLGWTIVATVLAVNFVILIFFVARDIFLAQQSKAKEKVGFDESSGHARPTP